MLKGKYFLLNNKVYPTKEFKDPFRNNNLNIYEVVRIDEGIPLFLEDHLERLKKSFNIAGKKLFLSDENIKEQVKKLTGINNIKEALVRIVFSLFDENNADVFVFQNKVHFPSPADYRDGVICLLQHSERNKPGAKIFNTSVRGKANELISAEDVYETLLVNSAGKITEGSRSNVFFIKGNTIRTAPDEMVLRGITRNKVIGIIASQKIPLEFSATDISELNETDAIFITGTTPKVLPVRQVNDLSFNPDHEITRLLIKAYDDIVEEYKNNAKS